MLAIDSEHAATVRAVEYLKSRGIAFARCAGAVRLPKGQTALWRSNMDEAIRDDTWLWQIDFDKQILPPNKVATHNTFSVFIDSQTGMCGIFS
jgi:hypothetical protein